jgi:hypothetical protein
VEVELTLDGLAGEAPAGIGVLESGPIASGSPTHPPFGAGTQRAPKNPRTTSITWPCWASVSSG